MKYGDMPSQQKYTAQVKGDAGQYEVWGINWYSQQVCIFRAGELEWMDIKKIKLTPVANSVEIQLSESTTRAISYLKCPATGKELSPQEVIQALADDLGMTNTRPGSWEGDNMQRVIDGHGWESHLSS